MHLTIQHKDQAAQEIKVVIKLQLIVVSIAMITIALSYPHVVKSALYGSLVALLNAAFLYWRIKKANQKLVDTPEASLKLVYRSGIERFVLIGCLLAIGMDSELKLSPLVVLISFIIGQLVFLLGVVSMRSSKNNIK